MTAASVTLCGYRLALSTDIIQLSLNSLLNVSFLWWEGTSDQDWNFRVSAFLLFFFFACKCQFYFLLTWYFQESLILFKSRKFTLHVTVSVYGYLWRDIKYSKDYYAKTSRTKSSYAFWFVLKLQRRPLVSRLLLNRHQIKHQLKL